MYGNGYYVAVGNTRILRSADGITWSFTTNATYLYRAAYCAGVFKAAGANGAIWTSTDGLTWAAETSGTTETIRGISYADDQFAAVGFNGTILTKGTMAGTEEGDGGEPGGGGGETGGGDEPLATPDETGLPQVAAAQPKGPLSGVVVFTSAGHGFGANSNLTAWVPERPLLYGVNEDIGNVDQMNRFAEAAWKAGATVVPIRPLGYQTNEVVLDNMDTNLSARGRVTFGGTWYNSTQTIYYGNAGDAVSYRYAGVSTNSSTSWASYRPNLPEAGEYPVYTWVRHGSDRANQLYRVYHSGGVTDVRVNHRDVGCGWVWLGNYHFEAGTNGHVNIGNHVLAGETGTYVFADAIRFGNGRGNVSRGTAGISGFEQELESGRFWVIKSMGQGMDSSLYDLAGYDDRSDNIGQPARMAAYMSRTNDSPRWRRVYVGFHSNAGTGSSGARRDRPLRHAHPVRLSVALPGPDQSGRGARPPVQRGHARRHQQRDSRVGARARPISTAAPTAKSTIRACFSRWTPRSTKWRSTTTSWIARAETACRPRMAGPRDRARAHQAPGRLLRQRHRQHERARPAHPAQGGQFRQRRGDGVLADARAHRGQRRPAAGI
jgi:hypothetical protein